MNYQDALNQQAEILDQTYHSTEGTPYTHFVCDGLIDAKKYYSIPLHILIIGRESYSSGPNAKKECIDTGWIDYLSHGGAGQAQNRNPSLENASKWIHIIREAYAGNEFPIDHATKQFRAQQLSTIAWINLKRESNTESAYCGKTGFANELPYTAQFIKRQIDLYNPHIVLCGGTYDEVKKFIFNDANQSQKYESSANGFNKRFERYNKMLVVDCQHPAARHNVDSQRHLIYSIIKENSDFLHDLVSND